jgi:hypothetical protein
MLILVECDFVGFNALLIILDSFVYITGDQIKDGEIVIRMQEFGGRDRREETTMRPNVDGRAMLNGS